MDEVYHEACDVDRAYSPGRGSVEGGDVLDVLFLVIAVEFARAIAGEADAHEDSTLLCVITSHNIGLSHAADDDVGGFYDLIGIGSFGVDNSWIDAVFFKCLGNGFPGRLSSTEDDDFLRAKKIVE